jgi:hypothetical protein
MKAKVLVMIGILIIAFAAVVTPVMAASTTTITGNPTAVIAVSVTGGTVNLALNPQISPATDSSQTLTVSANAVGWTVAAKDGLDGSKPVGTLGFMVEAASSGGAYITPTPKNLTAVMNVTGGIMTGANAAPVIIKLDKAASGGTIETGTAAVDGTTGSITFSQIANYVDQRLTGPETYQMVVTFTGTAA